MEVILVQGVNKKIMSQTYVITQNFQNQIEKNHCVQFNRTKCDDMIMRQKLAA